MNQTKIWDHFQNNDEMDGVFDNAFPRYQYIAQQIASGMSVLNIGVGRGGLENILLKKGALVSCLDPSESTIEKLRKQYELGERAQVGFSQAIPYLDGQFDAVVMSEVLEHLSDEVLSSTLIEVRRVLKPDGRLIGTVPANESLLDNQTVCPHCGEAFHRWGHLQSFSVTRLRELFLANNFVVLRTETRAFPDWRRSGWRNLVKSFIRYVLGRAGSPISSPNIYFEARR
jgi:SAM-dependent methyltransferase